MWMFIGKFEYFSSQQTFNIPSCNIYYYYYKRVEDPVFIRAQNPDPVKICGSGFRS